MNPAAQNPKRLAKIPLFSGLSYQTLQRLDECFETVSFPKGSIIFDQGDRADRLYVVVSGRVAIQFNPEDGETLTVTEIENDGVFGWSSALGRRCYTSCAICLEDCEALSVEGDTLRELCEAHPETGVIILERLAEVIAERLKNTHKHVVEILRQGMAPNSKGAATNSGEEA
jgi:CRP/FNR family transcriptional regulator